MDKTTLNKDAVDYLMASYLYYVKELPSPISDGDFDKICQRLLSGWEDESWTLHRNLISKSSLQAGTCFDLKKHHYPTITRVCAMEWYLKHNPEETNELERPD